MSSLLYYSISSNLTEDEITKNDLTSQMQQNVWSNKVKMDLVILINIQVQVLAHK